MFWSRRKVKLEQLEDGWQDQQFRETVFQNMPFLKKKKKKKKRRRNNKS